MIYICVAGFILRAVGACVAAERVAVLRLPLGAYEDTIPGPV
jgi:hypothetical protein